MPVEAAEHLSAFFMKQIFPVKKKKKKNPRSLELENATGYLIQPPVWCTNALENNPAKLLSRLSFTIHLVCN